MILRKVIEIFFILVLETWSFPTWVPPKSSFCVLELIEKLNQVCKLWPLLYKSTYWLYLDPRLLNAVLHRPLSQLLSLESSELGVATLTVIQPAIMRNCILIGDCIAGSLLSWPDNSQSRVLVSESRCANIQVFKIMKYLNVVPKYYENI